MVQLRAWVVAIGMLVAGCGSPSKPAASQSAAKTGTPIPPGLEPMYIDSYGRFDGVSLSVYTSRRADRTDRPPGFKQEYTYKGHYLDPDQNDADGVWQDAHYELRGPGDKVILPLDYQQIFLIPGQGAFVLPAEGRLANDPTGLVANSKLYYALHDHRTKPADALPTWKQYDHKTGQLRDTDIVLIERYQHDRRFDFSLPEELRKHAWVIVHRRPNETIDGKTIGRLDLDTLSPTGELTGHYEHVAVPFGIRHSDEVANFSRALKIQGRYSVVSTYRVDGTLQDNLLGRMLELIEAAEYRIVQIGDYLAKTAPGTSPQDELYWILQRDGRFAAPPGVIGLRPVDTQWWPGLADQLLREDTSVSAGWWLVRYAMPGEPGYVEGLPAGRKWGRAGWDLTLGPRLWDSATIVQPPILQGAFKGDYFWDRAFTLTEIDGVWTAEALDQRSPRRNVDKNYFTRTGRTPEDATQAMFAHCTEARLELQQYEQWKRDKEARDAAEEREKQWQAALRRGDASAMSSLVWSRKADDWWTYANAVKEPTPEMLTQAAGKMTDPTKKKTLLAKAEVRRKQIADEAAAKKRREEERKAEAARIAAMYNAPPSSSGSGMSGSDWGSKLSGNWNYTPPAPSAATQRRAYETQLNKQIYGTPWDPYR